MKVGQRYCFKEQNFVVELLDINGKSYHFGKYFLSKVVCAGSSGNNVGSKSEWMIDAKGWELLKGQDSPEDNI